jgi:hypothetical protein
MPLIQLYWWFLLVHVFFKVVKLYEVLGVLCLLFLCVRDLLLFNIVVVCAVLLLFVIIFVLVGFKSQGR